MSSHDRSRRTGPPKPYLRVSLVLTLTGGFVLGTVAPVSAGPLDKGGSGIITLSDGRDVPPVDVLAGKLGGLKNQLCKPTRLPKTKTVSKAAALRTIDTYLGKHTSNKARKKFKRSTAYKTPNQAMAAATIGVARRKPTLTVTALRRAHDLRPKSPTPLTNLAPTLTDLGMPNEALALLKQARKRKPVKRPAFGIPSRAVIDNNTAYALLALGKWKPAARAATAAIKGSPLLSEAQTNLALAELCAGDTGKAARAAFSGARRQGKTKFDLVMPGPTKDAPTRLPGPEILQLGKGQQPTIPTYRYRVPGMKVHPQMLAQTTEAIAWYQARQQDVVKTSTAYARHLQTLSPLTKRLTEDLVAALDSIDPDVQRLADVALVKQARLGDYVKVGQGGITEAQCGAYHGALLDWDKAWRNYTSAHYQRATALARELKAPAAHEFALAVARRKLAGSILLFGTTGANYTGVCDPAAQPPAARDDVVDGELAAYGAGACAETPIVFSLAIKVISLQVDCENVKVHIEGGGPFVNPFAYVNVNSRTGDVTIVAGGSVGAPIRGFKVGGPQSGAYVTFGRDGAVDAGWRTSPGVSVGPGSGAGSVGVSGGDFDISFVAGVAHLPEALGLR